MRTITIESYDKFVTWEVTGNNELPCITDIQNNRRTELTDYVVKMFDQRYGCKAVITEVKNKW